MLHFSKSHTCALDFLKACLLCNCKLMPVHFYGCWIATLRLKTAISHLSPYCKRTFSYREPVRFQFDGTHVVSGSLDTLIKVWSVETGRCLHTLVGHQSLTSGMELKNNILVSGNADSTVKMWDIISGNCLKTLEGELDGISATIEAILADFGCQWQRNLTITVIEALLVCDQLGRILLAVDWRWRKTTNDNANRLHCKIYTVVIRRGLFRVTTSLETATQTCPKNTLYFAKSKL